MDLKVRHPAGHNIVSGQRCPDSSTGTGHGGQQQLRRMWSNGYGSYGHGYNYGGNYGGGYDGGYGYEPLVVDTPNSQPYYPEYNVPLYGRYTYPAHSPHYDNSYNSYGKSY
ncbi:hypothetical protein RvY_00180 [Ramazzottius varieornatus]|uniref:Uncharacterized protein n=1 Tax=Ramazzottius varieornatus TaxID=947166 RepID=A0A1D1UI64_RAMVA|nr:hypothetical protein RvY_00180 [Ramazzottius varieornatus]